MGRKSWVGGRGRGRKSWVGGWGVGGRGSGVGGRGSGVEGRVSGVGGRGSKVVGRGVGGRRSELGVRSAFILSLRLISSLARQAAHFTTEGLPRRGPRPTRRKAARVCRPVSAGACRIRARFPSFSTLYPRAIPRRTRHPARRIYQLFLQRRGTRHEGQRRGAGNEKHGAGWQARGAGGKERSRRAPRRPPFAARGCGAHVRTPRLRSIVLQEPSVHGPPQLRDVRRPHAAAAADDGRAQAAALPGPVYVGARH